MCDNKPTSVEWGSVTMTVTSIQEAGHTEIQPLLCHIPEAVAVTTGLAAQVVSCHWQIQLEKLCNCHWVTFVSHTLSPLSDSCLSILDGILLLLTLSLWQAWCLSYCNSKFSSTWGHTAKFRCKLVACYMCSTACQKSCITMEVSCPVGQTEP